MSKVAITFRKIPQYSEHKGVDQPHLFAELNLSELGVKTKVKSLAIHYERLEKPVSPVRVPYTTNIAGLIFEAGNLTRLKQAIDDTLKALIRFERLPEYFFSVGENAYPIYHLPGQLLTRYPGGLVFSDTSIVQLRVTIADHFKSLGRIRNRREMGLLLGNLGFGLWWVKTLIARFGGLIYVESDGISGTTFILELPIAEGEK